MKSAVVSGITTVLFCIMMQSCLKPIEPVESPLPLPINVSDYWDPSGFMGDGEELGYLTVEVTEAKKPPAGVVGKCYEINYLKKGKKGFGGMKWLYPSNNWGSRKGIPISSDAKKVTFWVAAGHVENTVNFSSGPGNPPFNPAGWSTPNLPVTSMSTEWTQYEINLEGYIDDYVVTSIFGWTATLPTESSTMTFYVAGITVE